MGWRQRKQRKRYGVFKIPRMLTNQNQTSMSEWVSECVRACVRAWGREGGREGVSEWVSEWVSGFTRPGLEPTIYRTRGERASQDATDAVLI
jgi:hypothetical protein